VRDDRVVQVDRKSGIRDAVGVQKKFGVTPMLIPDFLALVGDKADGYPGIKGIGNNDAARLLRQYGPIESFPEKILGTRLDQALLFKQLATLRSDAALFDNVHQLRWRGPTSDFGSLATKIGEPRLLERAKLAAMKVS
jgi:5'-3' exonuclease